MNSILRSAIVVALALTLSPPTNGQDLEAVQRRLGGAIEAGELSIEQAHRMMDALREIVTEQQTNKKERYMAFAKEVKMAVKRGDLSEKDAEEKLIAFRREMFGNKIEDREAEANQDKLMEVRRKLEWMVREGELSKEEAMEKLALIQNEMLGAESEKLDRESVDRRPIDRRLDQAGRRIKAAVQAGDISPEEGREKFRMIREEMLEQAEKVEREKSRGRKKNPASKKPKSRRGDLSDAEVRERRQRYANLERRIKAAVEQGDMSPEDAEMKLNELKKSMFGDRD